MPEPALITAAQVAARLGYKDSWFYKHSKELVARHGFPPPVPCTTRWDPRAVEAWLDAQLPAAARLAPPDELAEARERLARRAEELAKQMEGDAA